MLPNVVMVRVTGSGSDSSPFVGSAEASGEPESETPPDDEHAVKSRDKVAMPATAALFRAREVFISLPCAGGPKSERALSRGDDANSQGEAGQESALSPLSNRDLRPLSRPEASS